MAYIKKLRGRNVSGVVTAYGEVLFAPGGDVNRWTNRFAARIGAETRRAAPTNKRPRWSHYGPALKSTITASRPEYRQTLRGARVYAAVGSTAPYAYYVDQGTGVYGGNGPYPAKVLPPWQRGEGSLYEATWRPGGPGKRRVAPVMIKGQKGQQFFDKGLRRGFARMRMRSFQIPGEGASGMSEALASFPRGLERAGNTPVDEGFKAELEQWRTWRDEAWSRADSLGRTIRPQNRMPRRPPRSMAANLAAYRASVEAAKRRDAAQRARLKEEMDRKEAGRKRREEERQRREERDRKLRAANALRRGNEAERRAAMDFYEKIRQAYPEANFGKTTLADGVVVYQVSYTLASGETVRRRWAYGYNVD